MRQLILTDSNMPMDLPSRVDREEIYQMLQTDTLDSFTCSLHGETHVVFVVDMGTALPCNRLATSIYYMDSHGFDVAKLHPYTPGGAVITDLAIAEGFQIRGKVLLAPLSDYEVSDGH